MIYFIATTDLKYVKIGFSKDPEKRVKELQTGNPQKLILLATVDGNIGYEKNIHKYFKKYKTESDNEWFLYNDRIEQYIWYRIRKPHTICDSSVTKLLDSETRELEGWYCNNCQQFVKWCFWEDPNKQWVVDNGVSIT